MSTGQPDTPLAILLISATALYRQGLARLLEEPEGVCVLATAGSAEEAMSALGRCDPDVVLLDVGLREGAGLARTLSQESPETPVVAFGFFEDEKEMLDWAQAGVAGYVDQHASVAGLLAAVRAAQRGELVCSPKFAGLLLHEVGGVETMFRPNGRPLLTRREYEVLSLLAEGLQNKEIAAHLQLGVHTVKKHVHSLLVKLEVSRRAEAVTKARRLGVGLAESKRERGSG